MHLSVKTANNKGFNCFQLKDWFFLYYLAEKNEIERLQLHLLLFDNNFFENNSKKAFKPSEPAENLGSLYPWILKGYCGQSKQRPCVCNFLEIMAPCFEGLNNSQKFTVVSFVSSFGRNHFMQKLGYRMPLAQVISQLTQHSTNSMPRRVSFNLDVLFRIKVLKDKGFSKDLKYLIKSPFSIWG